jgi:hypothetical protein
MMALTQIAQSSLPIREISVVDLFSWRSGSSCGVGYA